MQKRSAFRLARELWDSLTRLNSTTHKTLATPTDASEDIAKWLRQLHAVWCSLQLIALLDKYNTYSPNQNMAKNEKSQAEMAEISHSPTTYNLPSWMQAPKAEAKSQLSCDKSDQKYHPITITVRTSGRSVSFCQSLYHVGLLALADSDFENSTGMRNQKWTVLV